MSTRKSLIGLFAALLLFAAACSGDDRPSFDESVDDGSEDSTSGDPAADSGSDDSTDSTDSTDSDGASGEDAAEATPEVVEDPLVKQDPPPPPDPALPPQPTAEDAIAVYAALALEASFVGDCANKADGDTSQTLCYITDGVTWSVGLSETDLWYLMVVSQVEGGWVVTEVNLWGPPVAEGDPATEEGT